MFVVTVPALRVIEDAEVRLRVLRVTIYRFGWLAWVAMGVIVLSGISNLFEETDEFSHVFDGDYRYFNIFAGKMVLVGLVVLLTALHTFVVGPRQLRLTEEMGADSPDVAPLRRASIVLSSLSLLVTLGVVYAGALLANHEYSFQLS
jgi:putative copper export protein